MLCTKLEIPVHPFPTKITRHSFSLRAIYYRRAATEYQHANDARGFPLIAVSLKTERRQPNTVNTQKASIHHRVFQLNNNFCT